jgi:ankyrin repeat protein
MAAKHGQLRAVQRLLALGVPIDSTNDQGVTALHLAAENGHRLVVDELLARGASMDLRDRVHGGTPLGRVSWFSRTWPTPERDEVRRVLAERSTDVFNVVYAGAASRLRTLLAEDPSRATARRPDGRSPLHVLAEGEVPELEPLLELLLQHGADPEARNDKGQTPLEVATAAGADEVVEALIRHGAVRRP